MPVLKPTLQTNNGGSNSGSSGSINTDTLNFQIWNSLHSLGLNDVAAAGVMGNMAQESSMNPNSHNSLGAGGLMQWLGPRYNSLVSYANSKGLSPNSADAQVGYFGQELKAGNEGITLQGLNNQSSPAAAALYVSQNYERPGAAEANNTNRESQANTFYKQYTGKTGAPLTSSSSGSSSSTNTNIFGLPDIPALVSKALGVIVGAGIVFLGLWALMNPLSDLTTAITSTVKQFSKMPLEGATNAVKNAPSVAKDKLAKRKENKKMDKQIKQLGKDADLLG